MPLNSSSFASQNWFDLYKLRLEESKYRYESMRNLEWRVLFQTYAGYAAIIIAFAHRIPDPPGSPNPYWGRLAATALLLFFLATNYLYFRIQQRLTLFGRAHQKNLDQVDEFLGETSPLRENTKQLGHKFFWTYDTQLILSTFTLSALLIYILKTSLAFGELGDWQLPVYCCGTAILVASIFILSTWSLREKRDKQEEDDKASSAHAGK